jgi:hypothetical protein
MATGQRAFSGNSATLIRDDVLNLPVVPARQLNPEIAGELEGIIHKTLEKDRELRYRAAADLGADLKRLKRETESHASSAAATGTDHEGKAAPGLARRAKVANFIAAAAVIVGLIAGGLYYRLHRAKPLTDKDTIVLADFDNKTGDAIFDDTLKTALNVSVRQSPFLSVLSESEIAKTLQQMTLPASTKLAPGVARELCQRAGGKAYIGGSIGSLGSEYVLGLKAVSCQNGDTLAQEQVTAASREKVLSALGDAASKLRGELGESLTTVHKFDVPLEQATTSSLDALQAYSLGLKAITERGTAAALPYLQRAIET